MGRKRKIVIASALYNNLKYTEAMLTTLTSHHESVVLLINNGSTDGTGEYLRKFLQQLGCAAISYPENTGVAHAWNTAIQFAAKKVQADYILILGNDTLLARRCIDTLVATADRTGAALVTATDYAKECEKPYDILNYKTPRKEKLTECPDFSCFLLRIRAVEQLARREQNSETKPGLFDEKFYPAYFEDNDYHYRLRLAGLAAYKTNRAAFYHFGSLTKNNNPEIQRQISETYLINEAYYARKWNGLPGHEGSAEANKQWI